MGRCWHELLHLSLEGLVILLWWAGVSMGGEYLWELLSQ